MAMYASVKMELWGVFFVGKYGDSAFRSLKAAFDEKETAEAWAKQYSKDNFGITMMVEEIKVTIPKWDGTVPNPLVTNPMEV